MHLKKVLTIHSISCKVDGPLQSHFWDPIMFPKQFKHLSFSMSWYITFGIEVTDSYGAGTWTWARIPKFPSKPTHRNGISRAQFPCPVSGSCVTTGCHALKTPISLHWLWHGRGWGARFWCRHLCPAHSSAGGQLPPSHHVAQRGVLLSPASAFAPPQ